jgi:sugar diacid utilization regulator
MMTGLCERLDPEGHLIAAVSTVCSAPEDYVSAYAQVRQVVYCLDAYCPPGTNVLTADELGAGRVFLASANPEDAWQFAQSTLGTLLESSAGRGLLDTLHCFFTNAESIRGTAAVLGIHENTVRYRLTRIEQLTGLSVATDSEARLTAQLALLVLRLRGAIPPRTASN